MNNENLNALTLAYKCVMRLGWSHSRLIRKYGITFPTLRRIREGRSGKRITDEYCMKVFLTIMNDSLHDKLSNQGAEDTSWLNNAFRRILLAWFEVEVK